MSLDDFLVTERTAPLSADMRRKMVWDLIEASVPVHPIVVACMTDADLIECHANKFPVPFDVAEIQQS
tara:strand:+ start:2414 stop:2617 length:204 start_codon:yes stop_codon:yes gene_type:complete